MLKLRAGWLILWLAMAGVARAEVTLPAVIASGMVLQRDAPLPIWGAADAGERVVVTLADQRHETTADENGRWRVTLDPLPVTARDEPPLTMTVAGRNVLELTDLLVGEVWLCAGQSNMAFKLQQATGGAAAIAGADHPRMRLFHVAQQQAFEPVFTVQGEWRACDPQSVREFSAVAYFFGRELHAELDVPIGLIASSRGGTPAEPWTSREALLAHPETRPIVDRWDEATARFDETLAAWREQVAAWEAQQAAHPDPDVKKPATPSLGRPDHPHRPSGLFHGMIEPLMPFALRGVAWYQGETNRTRAYQYRYLLPVLIADWRKRWGQGDFPFLVVQMPGFGPPQSATVEPSVWAELREGQLLAYRALSNVGLVVTIDVGDVSIHPPDKAPVGRRLAWWALHEVYGRDVAYTGPVVKQVTLDGDRAIVTFGPMSGALTTRDGGPLRGFAVAGPEGDFVEAEARIEGDRVTVRSPAVSRIEAVRYGWADNPSRANLISDAGLPATPFRSDDRPGVTDALR